MPQVGGQHAADDGQAKVRLLQHLWLAVCTGRTKTPTVEQSCLSTWLRVLSVCTVVLPMIMNYTQSNPLIRTLSKPLPANAAASPRLQLTQRSSFPSPRARIKPPQQHMQTMN